MFVRPTQKYDTTLNLPRILCLHGGGTNAQIFRMQCRVIERALQPWFRLVYAEASLPAQPGSDVTSVYKNYGPFKAWLQTSSEDRARTASEVVDEIDAEIATAMYLDDLKGATGGWVALLGFSQGAKIAASIVYTQQLSREMTGEKAMMWPDFRFAVLLAGRGPLVWLDRETSPPIGLADAGELSISVIESQPCPGLSSHVLQVPTVHVHGSRDPGLELHRDLYRRHCTRNSTILLEFDQDHRVPIKTREVNALVEAICLMAVKTKIMKLAV